MHLSPLHRQAAARGADSGGDLVSSVEYCTGASDALGALGALGVLGAASAPGALGALGAAGACVISIGDVSVAALPLPKPLIQMTYGEGNREGRIK